jgi:fumarate reductase subunit D
MENTDHKQKDIDSNKVMASLSYVWVLCLVPLVFARRSEFAQFHAKQGLLLFMVEILAWLVFWIPIFNVLLFIMIILFSLLGIRSTLDGKYWVMPILGKYVNKLNL